MVFSKTKFRRHVLPKMIHPEKIRGKFFFVLAKNLPKMVHPEKIRGKKKPNNKKGLFANLFFKTRINKMSASETFVEFEAIVDSFRARNDWCVLGPFHGSNLGVVYLIVHKVKCLYVNISRRTDRTVDILVGMAFNNTNPASNGFYFDEKSFTVKQWAHRKLKRQTYFGAEVDAHKGPAICLPGISPTGCFFDNATTINCLEKNSDGIPSYTVKYLYGNAPLTVGIVSEFDRILPLLFDKSTGYLAIGAYGSTMYQHINFVDVIRHPDHKHLLPFDVDGSYHLVLDDNYRFPFYIRAYKTANYNLLAYINRSTKQVTIESDVYTYDWTKRILENIFDRYAVPLLGNECFYCWEPLGEMCVQCTECNVHLCVECYQDIANTELKCNHCNSTNQLQYTCLP
jgi:hypothetical protein